MKVEKIPRKVERLIVGRSGKWNRIARQRNRFFWKVEQVSQTAERQGEIVEKIRQKVEQVCRKVTQVAQTAERQVEIVEKIGRKVEQNCRETT